MKERLQFGGEVSLQSKKFAGLGMGKGEAGGVEEVAVELEFGGETGDDVRCAVERVADYGVAESLGVDADLMGAAGFDADFDEGEGAVRGCQALKYVEVGDGGASVCTAGGHAGAADEVAGDGEGDGSVVFFEVAVEEGEVGLRDLTLREHFA